MGFALVTRNHKKVAAGRECRRQVPTTHPAHRAIDQEYSLADPSLPHNGDRVPLDVSGYVALAGAPFGERPSRHSRDAAAMGASPWPPVNTALNKRRTRSRDHQRADSFPMPNEEASGVVNERLLNRRPSHGRNLAKCLLWVNAPIPFLTSPRFAPARGPDNRC
jgi:hypothetical protein